MTKTYKCKMIIAGTLSFLCTYGPLITFIIMGLIQGKEQEKITLTITLVGAIALAALGALRKVQFRSTIFIVMIGLWVALDRLMPFMLTLAICTILDETIFHPLYVRWREDYRTNKQIDKRLNSIE